MSRKRFHLPRGKGASSGHGRIDYEANTTPYDAVLAHAPGPRGPIPCRLEPTVFGRSSAVRVPPMSGVHFCGVRGVRVTPLI